jgi:hypothetical protein
MPSPDYGDALRSGVNNNNDNDDAQYIVRDFDDDDDDDDFTDNDDDFNLLDHSTNDVRSPVLSDYASSPDVSQQRAYDNDDAAMDANGSRERRSAAAAQKNALHVHDPVSRTRAKHGGGGGKGGNVHTSSPATSPARRQGVPASPSRSPPRTPIGGYDPRASAAILAQAALTPADVHRRRAAKSQKQLADITAERDRELSFVPQVMHDYASKRERRSDFVAEQEVGSAATPCCSCSLVVSFMPVCCLRVVGVTLQRLAEQEGGSAATPCNFVLCLIAYTISL